MHAFAALPRFLNPRAAALVLVTLLASCGGGSGSDAGSGAGTGSGDSAPTGVGTATVQWTTPSAGQVLTTGSPVSLGARVLADGAEAANGSLVVFSAASGTSTSGLTQAGLATAAMAGLGAGRQQLQAVATVSGRAASASQTFYLRPQPAPLQILVPAYFYPSGGGATAWAALAASAQAVPTVQITAILNPSNGIFSSADASIVRAATRFAQAGGRLVAYVSSSYGTGTRSLASIEANIDNYLALYGSGLVQGFFIDEMAATSNRLDFYRSIYRYIKAKNPDLLVIGNPGTIPAAGYAEVADVLTTFEDKGSAYGGYDPRTPAADWLYGLPNSRQASLVHNVADCPAMQVTVQAAASPRYQAGWIYATSLEYEPATGVGNPWADLPGYWDALVQAVRSSNAGQTLPSCT